MQPNPVPQPSVPAFPLPSTVYFEIGKRQRLEQRRRLRRRWLRCPVADPASSGRREGVPPGGAWASPSKLDGPSRIDT